MRARLWNAVVSVTLSDVGHAIRRLRRAPGFTILCALTLAVGIGTSTAIISAVNPILFEPLPYPQPEHIVSIWDHGVDASHLDVTFGTFREISERNRTLDSIAVMRAWQPTVTGSGEPERLEGQRVSAKYFNVLAMSPMLGRTFTATDDLPNGPKVTILSDRLWHRRFSGDSNIIGRDITLDDDHFTVVGIMPPVFENVLGPSVELGTTLQYNPALPLDGREWGHHLRMIARVRDGGSVTGAAADLEAIARNPIPESARAPWAALGQGLIVSPLKEDVVTAVKPALLAILAAVVLMLLIACVNVTNLMLARGAQRKGEFAVRAALGAGRSRLIRHLLTETLLLTGFGGAVGMIVADLGLRLFVAVAPPTLPRATAMEVDSVTLAFGVAITILVGVAVGVIPAFRASATGLPSPLQFGSTRVAGPPKPSSLVARFRSSSP